MKFSCQQCSTAYNVPDEKVRGKKVRIACKKCGAPIVVEGPNETVVGLAPPGAMPQRPIRSFQRTHVGGLMAPDLTAAVAAAKAAAPPAEDEPWTVAIDRQHPAKLTTPDVVKAYAKGDVTAKTLVWKKGHGDWKPVFDVPQLASALNAAGHSPAGIRTPVAPAPVSSGFDDEDEATRVVDSASLPISARPSTPAKIKAPPPLPIPKAPRVARFESPPLSSSAPVPHDHGFDDEGEATKVIDPERAQQLLSSPDAAAGPPEPPPFEYERDLLRFQDDPGISHKLTPPQGIPVPTPAVRPPPPAPGEYEEEDVTQVATASAARELLEGVVPGLVVTRSSVPPEANKKPVGTEPLVVLSEEARQVEQPVSLPKRPSSRPPPAAAMQFHIQNEPTRIVQVRSRTNKSSLIVALVVVIIASAAGGFLASRFVPDTPSSDRSR